MNKIDSRVSFKKFKFSRHFDSGKLRFLVPRTFTCQLCRFSVSFKTTDTFFDLFYFSHFYYDRLVYQSFFRYPQKKKTFIIDFTWRYSANGSFKLKWRERFLDLIGFKWAFMSSHKCYYESNSFNGHEVYDLKYKLLLIYRYQNKICENPFLRLSFPVLPVQTMSNEDHRFFYNQKISDKT